MASALKPALSHCRGSPGTPLMTLSAGRPCPAPSLCTTCAHSPRTSSRHPPDGFCSRALYPACPTGTQQETEAQFFLQGTNNASRSRERMASTLPAAQNRDVPGLALPKEDVFPEIYSSHKAQQHFCFTPSFSF